MAFQTIHTIGQRFPWAPREQIVIPYKDENPSHILPVVTYGILLLNVLSWLVLQGLGAEPALSESICNFGAIPSSLTGSLALQSPDSLVCPPLDKGWITTITSMFMHGGWLHLIGNMWFLWIFADNIEDAFGHVGFVIFYILGGLAAVGAQVMADPGSTIPMVGASGAIGGVMGAYARIYPKVRVHIAIILGFFVLRHTIPAFVMLGLWLALQFVSVVLTAGSSAQGGVAFWAHIGGFLAGFLLVPIFKGFSGRNMREI